MFYKEKYREAAVSRDIWRDKYFNLKDNYNRLRRSEMGVRRACDWLENENAKLRRKDAFTFDKAEFQRLKLENVELRAKLEDLERKGAKK